jgi:hypothetical protein
MDRTLTSPWPCARAARAQHGNITTIVMMTYMRKGEYPDIARKYEADDADRRRG